MLTLINIKENNALQKFLLCLVGNLLNLSELYILVYEQCK